MRWLLFTLLLTATLFASGKKLSSLPLPQVYFLNLDTYACDRYCLQKHLQRGEIFSFLAKLRPELAPYFRDEIAQIPFYRTSRPQHSITITLIAPTPKLSFLLTKTAQTITYALIHAKQPFKLQTFISSDLQERLDEAQQSDLIILFLPYAQRAQLAKLHSETTLFIPTIHKRFVEEPQDFYYGGIDYIAQIERLLDGSPTQTTIFYTPKISLLNTLTEFTKTTYPQSSLIAVKDRGKDLKWKIKNRRSLDYGDILLNTPLVTTSLILSQLTLYDRHPRRKLSTQINLLPKLFEFTQESDRVNLIFANSISPLPPNLQSALALAKYRSFYDRIEYACIVAIDRLFLNTTDRPLFTDRQLDYDISLWRYQMRGFREIDRESSQEF